MFKNGLFLIFLTIRVERYCRNLKVRTKKIQHDEAMQ